MNPDVEEYADERAPADDAAAAGAVVVRLGEARYAVPMHSVAEVGRLPRVTRVPGAPPWVAGVANWRGRVLPVVDLRPLLGTTVTAPGTSGRLVVVSRDDLQVGLLTEGVESVLELPDDPAPVPGTLDASAADLLAGHVTTEQGPVAVLDVAAVLGLRDRLPRVRATA